MTSTGSRLILKEQEEFNGEEKRILDLLNKGLSRDFPNPQRIGCPGTAILKSIAFHKLPLAEADLWLEHFSSCSPCFQEFSEIRKQVAGQRRQTRMWLAAAAMVLPSVAGWMWVRSQPSGQTAAVLLLDPPGRCTARGDNPSASSQP